MSKADGATFGAGMGCGAFLAVILVPLAATFTLPASLVRGYVLSILWIWFALPMGAPEISYGQAVGLVLTAGFLRAPGKGPEKQAKEPELLESLKSFGQTLLSVYLLTPAITLLVGWCIHAWLM
jgi:hypothetical protein